ncbi:MAG: cupin domain-containing protein [Pseudomonadota bacterium]|mgnify:CR=1 FL=1|nr:cupin domain-containing protein [Pseudomonadota bacterium]
MKQITTIAILLGILSVPAFAATKNPTNAVFINAKDIKWSEVPGFAGVQTSTIEGNSEKGAHHAYMKFAPGFSAPLHHHSSDHFVTVVAGTLILTIDGQEQRLTAGSYFSFKNKQPHATTCAAGAECILFTDVRGKWDVVLEKK